MKQRLEEGPVIRREKRYMYLSSRIYGIAKQLIKMISPVMIMQVFFRKELLLGVFLQ